MLAIGQVSDALASVSIIALNVLIGTTQEIRAKRQLDRIALLSRPRVTALRGGAEKPIDLAEIVVGDVLIAMPGDQIVADGILCSEGSLEVDESLLTGESDLVLKQQGDELSSGSFCVTGRGLYEVTSVGENSYANKLTAQARRFRVVRTPLQREITLILRLLMLVAGFIGLLMLIATVLSAVPFMRQVQMAAVIAGVIPNGLFLMMIVSYAMGSLRISQQGALVQQANAVESLSNVTVLCTDKTGTLTANRINYREAYPIGVSLQTLEAVLGDMARSATTTNKTTEALQEHLPGAGRPIVDEVRFSSDRKWSALAFDRVRNSPLHGVYAIGAPEMLEAVMPLDRAAQDQIAAWSGQGLRVIAVGHNPEVSTLHNADGKPELPELTALGLVCLSDELRPHLQSTLESFVQHGISVKVISGDNPQTVAALARQAGLPGELKTLSGPEIDAMDEAQLDLAVDETTIFGRITPQQKERLVDALRRQGQYVAMIGDGVNDVLSLKKANLGIAMQSGSSATRAVADMVLLEDSFSALPYAFTEGQRILNGMSDILRLFLPRTLYVSLMIIATAIINLGFPFLPMHNTLITLLTVGIPTFFLAIWARPGLKPKRSLLSSEIHFILPAAGLTFLFGLLIYTTTVFVTIANLAQFDITPEEIAQFQTFANINYDIATPAAYLAEAAHLAAQTTLTVFLVFVGLLMIIFVEPPHPWFVGGDEYSGDIRPTVLAGIMGVLFILIFALEPTRAFFKIVDLPLPVHLLIGGVAAVWALVLRRAWRRNWLERFLQIGPYADGIT